MRNIIWTTYFDEDVRNVATYIRDYFGKDYSNNFVIDVKLLMGMLSEFPEIGRLHSRDKEVFKYTLKRRSLIYFRYDKKQIEFIGLKDTRQDLSKIKFK